MADTKLNPYLNFNGNTREAMEFYKAALGGELRIMTFGTFPGTPDDQKDKVMHASFRVRGVPLMASDGCDDKAKFDGFRLALTVPAEADARKAFDALADGGSVQMPLSKTFWSPCYGMVTDRFGLGWMVMVTGQTD